MPPPLRSAVLNWVYAPEHEGRTRSWRFGKVRAADLDGGGMRYSSRLIWRIAFIPTGVSISYGAGGGLGMTVSSSARSLASNSRILASTSACFVLLRTMSSR